MLAYKIQKACTPPKINFLERRYGPEIDREIAIMNSNIECREKNLEEKSGKGKVVANETYSIKQTVV